VSSTATAPRRADRPPAAGPEHPARARFVERQDRLLRHYGLAAVSRYVQLERPLLRAHLLEAGVGEPAIILHGGDGQAVDWAPLMSVLQRDLRMYAVDRPGFGLSDPFDYRRVDLRRHAADFVTALLDALELETATIIGGSMGGFFALATALERPERVRALVLVGMPAGIGASAPLPLRVVGGIPGMSRLFMANLGRGTASRKRQYQRMFRVDLARIPDVFFDTQLAGLRIPGAKETWAVLLRRLAGLRGLRDDAMLVDELPRIGQPTLVVWGEHDMVPVRVGRTAAERMPNARFELMPGIGHFPFLEAARECGGLIVDFLTETFQNTEERTLR
jgi:pimeloyl-ACP methyl ester carboxylesterase